MEMSKLHHPIPRLGLLKTRCNGWQLGALGYSTTEKRKVGKLPRDEIHDLNWPGKAMSELWVSHERNGIYSTFKKIRFSIHYLRAVSIINVIRAATCIFVAYLEEFNEELQSSIRKECLCNVHVQCACSICMFKMHVQDAVCVVAKPSWPLCAFLAFSSVMKRDFLTLSWSLAQGDFLEYLSNLRSLRS